MAGRRYGSSEVVYDDRRERDYASRGGHRDDRYVDREEIEIRRSSRGPPVREREREETREPAYLREDYGRTSAGPMVLRAREREDFEFVARPRRRSPTPERKVEKESIIIRRDESEGPPRRERSREREEIIIRRDESERPPPRLEPTRDREEIIIRRDQRDRSRPPPPPPQEREEIIIKRTDFDDTASRRSYRPAREHDREEIIIRRDEEERRAPRDANYALVRPKSRERERSSTGRDDGSEDEIIIRRDERSGRRGDRDREEIIIRHRSHSSSPSRSEAPSSRPAPMDPQIVNAPQIHQEIITHHRHIDHGYELMIPPRPRPVSRPPSPPSPPPPAREEERIEIRRSGERNGRAYDEDIIIDRNEGARSAPPRDFYDPPARREPTGRWESGRDVAEEAEYYNERAMARGYPGEGYHGSTRDWALVDVPPGTRRVRMDGAGGGAQEITWQRYNGDRRAKFYPETDRDEAYVDYERSSRPAPAPLPPPEPIPQQRADIGGRFGKAKDPTDGLWTEITKDLVVKEAILEMGYEFEENEENYYIISYLKYDDVARLVGLSEDIRKDRRKRLKEIEWESRVGPPEEEPRPRLAIESGPPPRSRSPWEREDERYIEREVIYRGGRPPPPIQWRR